VGPDDEQEFREVPHSRRPPHQHEGEDAAEGAQTGSSHHQVQGAEVAVLAGDIGGQKMVRQANSSMASTVIDQETPSRSSVSSKERRVNDPVATARPTRAASLRRSARFPGCGNPCAVGRGAPHPSWAKGPRAGDSGTLFSSAKDLADRRVKSIVMGRLRGPAPHKQARRIVSALTSSSVRAQRRRCNDPEWQQPMGGPGSEAIGMIGISHQSRVVEGHSTATSNTAILPVQEALHQWIEAKSEYPQSGVRCGRAGRSGAVQTAIALKAPSVGP
jgi:hypothetical protein